MLLTVTMGRGAWVCRLLLMFASLCCAVAANAGDAPVDHQLGTQYSPLRQIHTGNVAKLTKAWEFHTGDDPNEVKGLVAMEDQPSLIEGNLVVCSTNRRLIALNPVTGRKRWQFDPGNNVGKLRKCRGITSWIDRDAAVP
jgi:quinoprotein glucose dehydrogenase